MRTRFILLISIPALAGAACGGNGATTGGGSSPSPSPSPTAIASPSPSPLVAPEHCQGSGSALKISAKVGFWVLGGDSLQPGEACLRAPSGPFTVTLSNDVKKEGLEMFQPEKHNFSIYKETTLSTPLFKGKLVQYGKRFTYHVPRIPVGVYPFVCDVHPRTMTGVLVVE